LFNGIINCQSKFMVANTSKFYFGYLYLLKLTEEKRLIDGFLESNILNIEVG